tara:strand:- start:648 stop:773 length:126 start_codon:yes stop_codon:yes gene_type:complete
MPSLVFIYQLMTGNLNDNLYRQIKSAGYRQPVMHVTMNPDG